MLISVKPPLSTAQSHVERRAGSRSNRRRLMNNGTLDLVSQPGSCVPR
jgi:hypothetical protein